MKVSRSQLRRIIKESLNEALPPLQGPEREDVPGDREDPNDAERDELMNALQQKFGLKHVRTTEEFGTSPGGIWLSGEERDLASDGIELFNSYAGGRPPYDDFGVHTEFNKFIEPHGFFAEWYDAGTLMLWRV